MDVALSENLREIREAVLKHCSQFSDATHLIIIIYVCLLT